MRIFRGFAVLPKHNSFVFITGYADGKFQIVVGDLEFRLDPEHARTLLEHIQEYLGEE